MIPINLWIIFCRIDQLVGRFLAEGIVNGRGFARYNGGELATSEKER
jgi:hypothetical protein